MLVESRGDVPVSWYMPRCFGFSAVQCTTWGMKPSGCWLTSRVRSSASARPMSRWDRTMAWKHESQNHWKGYVLADGQT